MEKDGEAGREKREKDEIIGGKKVGKCKYQLEFVDKTFIFDG